MKFYCSKSLLQQAVSAASQAVYAKSAVPALESILIEAQTDVQISGYDLKTGISTRIDAEVDEPGSLLLNARLFADIVRRLPGESLTIETDERLKAKIYCEMSVFEIMGISADEYPELPSVNQEYSIEMPQDALKDMIGKTIFAVSDSEARPVHTGSLFEVENGVLSVVSVDGYRLALRRLELKGENISDGSFVVPGSALAEVAKLASNGEETVKISVGAKHILFNIGDTILVSRRLEGEFLNYKQAIPQNSKYSVVADRRALSDCIERVSLIINDRLKNPVRCVFDDGLVKMSTISALGRATDECAVEGDCEGLEIGFNNRYLLEALKAVDDEKVKLLLNSGVSPCMIVPVDDKKDYLYMILPVRLKAGE